MKFIFSFMTCLLFLSFPRVEASQKDGRSKSENEVSWSQKTLHGMNLEQKIAQMFCGFTTGYFLNEDHPEYLKTLDLVERFQIGGLMLYRGTPLSQLNHINRLQQESKIPLWISQDLEWGTGMRVEHTTTFPSMMALGATRDSELAYAVGRVIAREVSALGVHQAYAPVADINNNPLNPIINVRSFGETPDLVSQLAMAYMQGLQDGGVMATAKHFPGHGDTAVDSHVALPVLPFDLKRLETVELRPFRDLIKAGVGSIMVGHLAVPALERESSLPATLSPEIVEDFLRKKMEFDGLIVTDAMSMKGITNEFGMGEAHVRAIEAGNDILLMSKDPYAARRAIVAAVKSGRLSEQRIDRSVLRILQLKETAKLNQTRVRRIPRIAKQVAGQSHLVLSEEIARRSLTLLNNQNGLLPILDSTKRILCLVMSDTDDPKIDRFLRTQFKNSWNPSQIEFRLLDRRSHKDEFDDALVTSTTFDLILLPCFFKVRASSGNMAFSRDQKAFFNRVVQGNVPVAMISLGSPYLTFGLNQPQAHLAGFSDCEATQLASIQALFGLAGVQGKLPISVPGSHTFGDGIKTKPVRLRNGHPMEVGMSAAVSRQVDDLMRNAIRDRVFPAAAVAIGRAGVLVKNQGYGTLTYESEHFVTADSKFDLASLTKVIATTTAAMSLFDQGKLKLDDPVAKFLPKFALNGKEKITIFHLLSHSSGLAAHYAFHTMGMTQRDQITEFIMADKLQYSPGKDCVYSDLGLITLALIIEKITGTDLDSYLKKHFWKKLGMNRTAFRPIGKTEFDPLVVPTEVDGEFRKRLIQGEVHDETAFILGGIAGHAGLFSTSTDLAKFAYMMLQGGRSHGISFLKDKTIELFTTRVETGEKCTRALGWDTKTMDGYSSAGSYFGTRSFGHTGFTGTSIWMDPDQELFVILLTNRVYPSREEKRHREIRARLADIAYQAIQGPPELDLSTYKN